MGEQEHGKRNRAAVHMLTMLRDDESTDTVYTTKQIIKSHVQTPKDEQIPAY